MWRKFLGTYADDHGNSAAQSTTANPPVQIFGNLQAASDVDWFRFSATAGVSYQLSVELLQLANSRLRLIGTDGTTELLADLDGGAALLDWSAPANGTYYLQVSSASDVGTYTVSVLSDDHGNTAATATPVLVPSTTSGTLHKCCRRRHVRLLRHGGLHLCVRYGVARPRFRGHAVDRYRWIHGSTARHRWWRCQDYLDCATNWRLLPRSQRRFWQYRQLSIKDES